MNEHPLGLGQPPRPELAPPARRDGSRQTSAPSSPGSSSHSKRPPPDQELAGEPEPKRKSVIHQRNATDAFQHDINLSAAASELGVDYEDLLRALTTNVIGVEVVTFRNATQQQIERLGGPERRIAVRRSEEGRLKEEGAVSLALTDDTRKLVRLYVSQHYKAGCRLLIDSMLLAAVHAAQIILDAKSRPLASLRLDLPPSISSPSFAIFPEVPIEPTIVDPDIAVSFRGRVDYLVSIIDKEDRVTLPKGKRITTALASSVTVLEARTEADIEQGMCQLIAQVMATRRLTGRGFYMGVLTSGMTYSFALVVSNDKGLRHYRTRPYYVPEDEALIAGVLTQIISEPNRLPSCFELRDPDE